MVEKGQIKTSYELEKEGWTYVYQFSSAYVYTKGDKRLMWNPDNAMVLLVFTSDDKFLTW